MQSKRQDQIDLALLYILFSTPIVPPPLQLLWRQEIDQESGVAVIGRPHNVPDIDQQESPESLASTESMFPSE